MPGIGLVRLVNSVNSAGKIIDGVGTQMHLEVRLVLPSLPKTALILDALNKVWRDERRTGRPHSLGIDRMRGSHYGTRYR